MTPSALVAARPSVDSPRPTSTEGCGLTLVQAVALRWGWEATRDGKTVWAILRARGGARPAASANVSGREWVGLSEHQRSDPARAWFEGYLAAMNGQDSDVNPYAAGPFWQALDGTVWSWLETKQDGRAGSPVGTSRGRRPR